MNSSHSCGDKRLLKPLIGTVINIPAASAETVAASVTVVGSAPVEFARSGDRRAEAR
jgi:hypothetical protein